MERYTNELNSAIKDWFEENAEDCTKIAKGEISTAEYFDRLMLEDSITGNGSGSYNFSKLEAIEVLSDSGILFNEDFIEHLKSAGIGLDTLNAPEKLDVVARCYTLEVIGANGIRRLALEVMDGQNRLPKVVLHENVVTNDTIELTPQGWMLAIWTFKNEWSDEPCYTYYGDVAACLDKYVEDYEARAKETGEGSLDDFRDGVYAQLGEWRGVAMSIPTPQAQ